MAKTYYERKNVDGLHQKALWPAVNRRSPSPLHEDILELHGTLHVCFFIPSVEIAPEPSI